MARGSKYPDVFAAGILAECDLSSTVGEVLKARGIPARTYQDWLNRSDANPKFAQLRAEKRKVLEREWKRFALTSLRVAFLKATELIAKCDKPEDLEYINDHIKTVGDLAVNIEVLNDFEQGEAEAAQTQSQSTSATRA